MPQSEKFLAHYQITARLGAGGMGEVFRARDTRLNREVAIKVLPKEFANHADRLRRFEQESKTLAALNHPNILTIYDADVFEGAPYLVSELLEGKTLREELATSKAALPVRKATDYAMQFAQGLAAAHSKGIIHRDLKPENIFVTKEGRVKILDFGLAKLQETSHSALRFPHSPFDSEAPTLAESTQPGMVLGTPAYMSPEQVRGEPADHRSDIFAFGCVLYEMLTGNRAFRQDTPVETMHAVLSEEVDLSAVSANFPSLLERIVRRCLDKQPARRFQSAEDLAFTLEALSDKPGDGGRLAIANRETSVRRKILFAGLPIAALAFFCGLLTNQFRSPNRSTTAASIHYLTYSGRDYSPSASADGKRVCFSSDRDGPKQIWVKEIASGWETALTSGPDDFPRFSRDGSMILFTRALGTNGALFRIPSIGGDPRRILDDVLSGDWSPDGRQVTFVRWPAGRGSLICVAGIDGSAETPLYRFPEQRCSTPRWSPDGKTIAVAINDSGRPQSLALLTVATRQIKILHPPHSYNLLSSPVWDATSQNLFYMQADTPSALVGQGKLFRQHVSTGQFQRLLWSPAHCRVLDLLPNGNFLFDARSPRENLKELPIGTGTGSLRSLTLGNSTDRQPTYSPDGQTIVFSSNRSGNLELWSISRKTGAVHRLTDDPGADWDPAFSPDGKRLIWGSNRSGNLEIWIANADGTAPAQVTHDGFSAENPTMTKDGHWIVYSSANPQTAGIWKIHPDGTGATELVRSPTAGNAEVSPDGKYAAYVENRRNSVVFVKVLEVETGADVPFEIPIESVKETVAILGRVRWMPDGKSLVFLGQDENGINGLFIQEFVPGRDTTNTRRPLGPFDPQNSSESFGISPDGRFITIAAWEQFFSIMVTEDLEYR